MTFFGRSNLTNRVEPPPIYPEGFSKKAGSIFFGIDGSYLAKVQKREIFYLVKAGFNSQHVERMSIEERRFYFNLILEERERENPQHKK